MGQRDKEVRPQVGVLRATESTTATGSTSSIVASTVPDAAYLVVVSTSDARNRRRPFLSLHSAEKAVERAESRGHAASLHLCRLVPVLAPVDGEVSA